MKRNRSLPFAAAIVGGCALFATLPLTGCGGGSASFVQNDAQPTFAGRSYGATIALANGQTGDLALRTNADGTATATLTIDDGTSRSRVVVATPVLNGTFDPATGAFSLSGSYTFGGRTIPVSLDGTLPFPPATTGGSIRVIADGQTFASSFGSVTPTPTPTPTTSPSPGATPAPTPTPSPTPSPNPGSGAFSFTLVSKSADCNFSDTTFRNLQVKQATLSGGTGIYAFTGRLEAGNSSLQISWQRLNAANGLVPEAFTFVPNPAIGAFGDEFQGILGTAAVIPIGSLSAGAWSPTGGRLIVESVVGRTVRVRGENVEFTPNRFNAISAKGSFVANFEATFQNVQGL